MELRVPGDKSITQRGLILASLAEGRSRLRGLLTAGDPHSAAAVLRGLGVAIPDLSADLVVVEGVGLRGLSALDQVLDCGNSGTCARLMLGVLAGQDGVATLTGDASLRRRPMGRVAVPLRRMGAGVEAAGEPGRLPLRVQGARLTGLDYLSPVASAQVKSALLFAGLTGGASVSVTEPVRSRDHTERMLTALGVRVVERAVEDGWRVQLSEPPDRIAALDLEVPGDPSSAMFLLVLAVLGGAGNELVLRDIGLNPTRTGALGVLARMGAHVTAEREQGGGGGEPLGTLVARPSDLVGVEIGSKDVPALIDEVPVLAVAAARARGVTRITGARELRLKETDRLAALTTNLRAVGVDVEELEDGLEIRGSDRPLAGPVRTQGDHRIAMAFGVLGALPGNRIEVDEPAVADVSFPGFWRVLAGIRRSAREVGRESLAGGPSRPPVVTIDGPAGSGKSSTAQAVARRLGFRHLDSGALYRAITYALLKDSVPVERWPDLTAEQLDRYPIRLEPSPEGFALSLAGHRLGPELRAPDVTAHVSLAASLPAVRAWLLDKQRTATTPGGLVADGRDMGTVVFPDAEVKVFLTADLRERARRRILQDRGTEPTSTEIDAEAARLEARDHADSERAASPLRRPEGAVDIDTTSLSMEEQVERIVGLVRASGDD